MNSSSAVAELERYLATPQGSDQRSNPTTRAHANLQALRDSGDEHFLFLRSILELLHVAHNREELLFYCITGCRDVVLSQWKSYSSLFRQGLMNFFLQLGMNSGVDFSTGSSGSSSSRTIQLACFSASVSLWKRTWNSEVASATATNATPSSQQEQSLLDTMTHIFHKNDSPVLLLTTPHGLFQYLEQAMQQSQQRQLATRASEFLVALIGEFAGKSAVLYRQPMEFHKQAHSTFEKDGSLLWSLRLGMQGLQQVFLQQQTTGAASGSTNADNHEDFTMAVLQISLDVLGWEFGPDAWDAGSTSSTSTKTLIRPPAEWREYLIRPDLIQALFHVYHEHLERTVHHPQHQPSKLLHSLGQLLVLLASVSGPIFPDLQHRSDFSSLLLKGSYDILATFLRFPHCFLDNSGTSTLLLDTLALVTRLIGNFRLATLATQPSMASLLQALGSIGRHLLQSQLQECRACEGDVDRMIHREWREEAIDLLLDGMALLCGDPWLLYSGTEESRRNAQQVLASTLAPLYGDFVTCRTQMASLEEAYWMAHEQEDDLDQVVREEISQAQLQEEMSSVANLGRLSLTNSLNSLSALLFQNVVPRLQSLWNENNATTTITAQAAAVLEETRLLTLFLSYLLTDDNAGETPVIPDSVIIACQDDEVAVNAVSSAIQAFLSLCELQASRIAAKSDDPRFSPILANSFLDLLNRWAPAYILPADYGASTNGSPSKILSVWMAPESAQQVINFCTTLCIHYQCYWPQERQVQESSSRLLLSLARRGKDIRALMVAAPSFQQLVRFHCLTAGIRHSAPPSELENVVNHHSNVDLKMVGGYQRLPYGERSRILTALLVACGEPEDKTAEALLNDCVKSVHDAFSSLVQALVSKKIHPENLDAKEMACLCVELYCGVSRASEMSGPERIPMFITPSLAHLSGLMDFYATDLTIAEGLLRLFRDYSEQFISSLDRDQCLVLFQAAADLLKNYSAHHCDKSRVVLSATQANLEEEQAYNDILCAIQLLIHLGTKDFIDICSSAKGVGSTHVTDMIFFGLQQIIPLMTQGLLQFPTLCAEYFSLVGFMMDTYPEKVVCLPFELLDAMVQSLLFGMSHHDLSVAKSSLQGLGGLAREQLKVGTNRHNTQFSHLLDTCARRLLQEVVFQSIVWDRLEAAGMALLPLAAVDVQRFAAIVQELTTQAVPEQKHPRLQAAFSSLLQPEVLDKVERGGYEGRRNRIRFKKDFEVFCHEIHSFLVLR